VHRIKASTRPNFPATANCHRRRSRPCRFGKYAKAALGKLWCVAGGRAEIRDCRQRARGADAVARGEAVLGIVLFADAKIEPGVKIIRHLPGGFASRFSYPGGVDNAAKPEAADDLAFLPPSASEYDPRKYGSPT